LLEGAKVGNSVGATKEGDCVEMDIVGNKVGARIDGRDVFVIGVIVGEEFCWLVEVAVGLTEYK